MNILIVVDMQNDFISGALGTDEAKAIVPKVKKRIESFLEEETSFQKHDVLPHPTVSGAPSRREPREVIFTRDTHGEDYLSTREGKKLPVSHCIKDTWGWEICPELLPLAQGKRIFDKPTFGSEELARYVSDLAKTETIESITLMGLCTDICVISNAMLIKAAFPEADIFVDGGCSAGVTPQSHKNALEAMKMCQIEVI